jgi:hypothetical protein
MLPYIPYMDPMGFAKFQLGDPNLSNPKPLVVQRLKGFKESLAQEESGDSRRPQSSTKMVGEIGGILGFPC